MNWEAIGATGEVLGALVVVLTLGYLAVQVRQNTAQQKREETVSIQQGQNDVVSKLNDPAMIRAYAMTAENGRSASPEDRSRAIIWVIQYLNHFQIVYDLYHIGNLNEERYKLWESFAISIVASKGLREWWDEEQGKSAFMPEIQALFDQKLNDENEPPVPFNQIWTIFNAASWNE